MGTSTSPILQYSITPTLRFTYEEKQKYRLHVIDTSSNYCPQLINILRTISTTTVKSTVTLDELLACDVPVRIRPAGRSMHPFIRQDDFITITPYSSPDLKKLTVGECIIFRDEGGRWLIHRVIKLDRAEEKIITKGDALLRPDRPVSPEMIRGKINLIERDASGRTHRLDRPLAIKVNRLIALLSRVEAALSFPPRKEIHISAGAELFGRITKAPKWLLTRICFP